MGQKISQNGRFSPFPLPKASHPSGLAFLARLTQLCKTFNSRPSQSSFSKTVSITSSERHFHSFLSFPSHLMDSSQKLAKYIIPYGLASFDQFLMTLAASLLYSQISWHCFNLLVVVFYFTFFILYSVVYFLATFAVVQQLVMISGTSVGISLLHIPELGNKEEIIILTGTASTKYWH